MSVYGALYSSVSGIRAQGTAIGIISDNISNVNTVGYKAGSQYFGTLVTNSGSGSTYSPGGVRAQNRQLISQQGLVQTTSSPLDIAIQGNGMFVVSDGPNGLTGGDGILYTRAGSFATDSLGNFINASGYYLQAWPLDSDGEIPANSSSVNTLQTVNIGEAFGEAAATTTVNIKANLDASKTILPGSGQTGVPGTDGTNSENLGITGSSIIVPNSNLGINIPSATGSGAAAAGTAASAAATTAGQTAGNASVAAGNNAATAAAAAVAAAAADALITAVTGAAAAATAAGTAAITATSTTTAATAAGTAASTAAGAAGQVAGDASVAAGGDSATAGAAAVAAAAGVTEVTSAAGAATAVTNAATAAIASSAAAAAAAGAAADAAVDAAAQAAGDASVLNGDTNAQAGAAAVAAGIAVPEVTAIPGAVAAVQAAGNAAVAASVLNGDTPAQTVTAAVNAMTAAANQAVAAGTTVAAVVAAAQTAANTAVAAATTVTAAVAAAAAAGGNAVRVANADFDGDALRITTASTFQDDFVYGGFSESNNIATSILGAATATQPFNGSGVSSGDAFTIVVNGDTANPLRFTYVPSSPVTENGEFNSLQTLAAAIDIAAGVNARVATVNGGEVRLYVSAEDARQSLAFAQVAGSTANFPSSLGLIDVPTTTANRWNTLEGLAALANNETQGRLSATVIDTTSNNAKIQILNADPLSTIQFENINGDTDTAAVGDFLTEFQLAGTVLDPSYNAVAGSTASSMSAGNIDPTFERTFTVYDSLGTAHDLTIGFVKVATNSWRAEIYAANADDIVSSVTGGDAGDRFIAASAITFDGNGNLSSISPNWLTTPPTVRWTSGASTSSLSIDLGDFGTKTGLSQSSGISNSTVTQNGAAVGLLDNVSIDDEGFVIANFNNGQSKRLYKIPIATFSNYNGMQSRNGNVFIQTLESGDVNLAESGSGGAGVVTPESLETSNTELSEELTDMIVAQRAYQASAKVITTADELLDELNRIT